MVPNRSEEIDHSYLSHVDDSILETNRLLNCVITLIHNLFDTILQKNGRMFSHSFSRRATRKNELTLLNLWELVKLNAGYIFDIGITKCKQALVDYTCKF